MAAGFPPVAPPPLTSRFSLRALQANFANMAYLKHINLENFKSWRGKQLIGPFMRFNCIMGPNGSGKSNLMDALSFVMGERAAALRVRHLSDLIHGAHVGRPVSRTARVSVRYCDEEDRETEFSRSISGETSEYRINDVHVTFAKYSEELQKIGVITKTQNCLVFQGAVESIALKDPRERTKMLEYISQSKELAEEYNVKKEALQKAQEDSQFHFNKKRSVTAEKKQVSQEKLEAQNYQVLLDELDQNRLRLSLTELYNNQQSIDALLETLAERRLAVSARNSELEIWEQEVRSHKKDQGRLSRELQHAEKEINSQDHVLSQARSQYIKVKVNTSHHTKKAEEVHGAHKKTQRQLVAKEQELEEVRQEMAGLEATWRAYEQQVLEEQAAQRSDVQLNQDQSERYEELKELARRRGAVLTQQAEKLHWDVQANHEQMAFHRRRKKEMEAAIRNHRSRLEDLTSRAEKLEEYNNSCRSSLDKHREQEEKLSAELERGRRRHQEVNQELGRVMEELGNARLDRQESKRQLQRKELLEKLRRLFPQDVYGRLSDLCSPVHKKYQLAVTKVFSRYISAIVVTTEKVARDCIAFMKEERAEPETFLPVDNLAVSPLHERLRELRGAKMAVDVVRLNGTAAAGEQLRKVVQFVCGNTLVCESIKEARSVAFDRGDRHKTVALDGTMFSKSGVISGGSSHLRTKARCWDEKDEMLLREQREKLSAELRDLVKLQRKESDVKLLTAQIQGVQTRLKYSGAERDNLLKKHIPQCQAEVSQLQSELANLDADIQMQQSSVEAKEAELNTVRQQVEQSEDLVFSDFCAEIGVSSIREYEQQHLKRGAELDRKRLEFESQCTRLNAKLEYDEEQLEQQRKKLQKIEDLISREERLIAEQRKEEKKLLAAVEEAEDKLLELKNQASSRRSQVAAGRAELDQKIQKLQDINKKLVKLQREVMSAESAVEQKRLVRHNMLLACKIQDVPIGLLSGNLSQISEVQLETDSESTAATMDIFEREAQLVIDYSTVESALRRMQGDEEMEAHLKQLRDAVASAEAVLLQTAAPNLKALEKMTELKEKILGVKEAFDASTRAARKCSQEFNLVKAQRFHRFSQCFEHVSVAVDQIYKRLCRNSSAQAILSADNPDEPYLGGINYSCVAPGKRFMSMDNLSGGEKAIAALAMIFAIHSFRPAPFFILDEVDAALDNTNISKVTRFIREECSSNMQIIAISLKEEFFSQADALLGVYADFDEFMFSRVLTLDLRPFPLKDETGGESGADGSLDGEVEP